MKRDMELIRIILLDTEGETQVDLSPYNEEHLKYHKKLLLDRGFIEGIEISSLVGLSEVIIESLTWAGHDFLDDARDDRVWQEAMQEIGKYVGSASLDVVKAVLAAVATGMITGGQP